MRGTRLTVLVIASAALFHGCSSDDRVASSNGPSKADASNDASKSDASSDAPRAPAEGGAVVTVPGGKIQGDTDGATRRFRGIPYAKPPVGALRWKPPAPPDAWSDTLQATDFGPQCAQPSWIQGPESDTEDCLTLNVWTP